MTDCNCLNCHYRKLNYAADGYSYVVECPLSVTPRPLAAASKHTCKHHFRDGLIVVPYSSISRYLVNLFADKFEHSPELLNGNTRLAEFLLTPSETTRLFKQLGEQFNVTVPEEKIPDLETFEQITNALYKAQFGK